MNKTTAQCAITELDALLQIGFDTCVAAVMSGEYDSLEHDVPGLRQTLKDLAVEADKEWLAEMYPSLV